MGRCIFLLVLLLGSCAPASGVNDAATQAIETYVAGATDTPAATNTPTLTPTPTPTYTPEPTFTPISTDIPLVRRVVRRASFDNLSSDFELQGNYDLAEGLLTLEDPLVSGDPWVDGSARIISTFGVEPRNGYLLLFRTKPDANFFVTIEWGPFGDDSYRALWIVDGQFYNIWTGRTQVVSRSLGFQYQPATWYYLLMWLNPDSIEGKIWAKDNPETGKSFRAVTGEDWAPSSLIYSVNVAEGTVQIDDFQQLEFSNETLGTPEAGTSPAATAAEANLPTPSGKYEFFNVSLEQAGDDTAVVSFGYQLEEGMDLDGVRIMAEPITERGVRCNSNTFSYFAGSVPVTQSPVGVLRGSDAPAMSLTDPGKCSFQAFRLAVQRFSGSSPAVLYQQDFEIPFELEMK